MTIWILTGLLFLIVMTRLVMRSLGLPSKPPATTAIKLVGRFDFVLRILLLTAFLVAVERSIPDGAYSGIWRFIGLLCASISGPLVVSAIRGRLLDAGLAGSHTGWLSIIWLVSLVLLIFSNRYWPLGLTPLLLLLIAGTYIPSRPGPAEANVSPVTQSGTLVSCQRCQQKNVAGARFCFRCGIAL
jgi:hypothetical protein